MVETTLCYIIHEKKVLMMYRNKKENDFHEGKWNGLGGKIEEGETAYEGIRREVLEDRANHQESRATRGLLFS